MASSYYGTEPFLNRESPKVRRILGLTFIRKEEDNVQTGIYQFEFRRA